MESFSLRGGFRGGGGGARGPRPPFQFVGDFFCLKYTIILSFCKRSVGAFDFFS